jgi:predicted TIM-barrel fold metal-dependent hydrolase
MFEKKNVRILVDHTGRPTVEEGVAQPGFRALLHLAATRRAYVKLSGFVKCSREPSPHDDVRPFIDALVDAYTIERCLWASDWPYLRAPARVDYGVQLRVARRLFPDERDRRAFMFDNAKRLFGF